MKAIIYQQFGNTDVLKMAEEPTPPVLSDQVLVKIKAVSINPMDWKIRKGEMTLMSGSKFPRHTGVDFSGNVETVGSSVTGFKKGDDIFGVVKNNMKDGALAEYVAVSAASVWKKPAGISYAEAAAIPIVGAAAVTTLQKMGHVNKNTRVLVNGAGGGFGMFLLQLLKQQANVTAVVGTKAMAYAARWGADSVVDYNEVDVLDQTDRYDVVVDLSGKMGYASAKRIMKRNALFINPTPKPIEIPTSIIRNLFRRQKHLVLLSQPSSANMTMLVDAITNGLQVEVSKLFPFEQFKEAYRFAEQGGVTGKVVIAID